MGMVKLLQYAMSLLVLIVTLVLLVAFNTDLGRFKPQLASLVSNLLERELRIDGPLHLTLDIQQGLVLQAADVHLSATDWSAEPDLARLDKLQLQLDLWSIFKPGPIMINQLESDGLRIYLEQNAEGLSNWVFFTDSEEADPEELEEPFELPVLTEQVALRDSVVSVDTPERDSPLQIKLSEVVETVARDRQVSLAAKGSIREEAIALIIQSDRLDDLATLRDVDLKLSGQLGKVSFSGHFAVADLLQPKRPTADLNMKGPSSEYLLKLFEVEQLTSGPLDLSLTLAPGQEQMQFQMAGQFGEFTTQAKGEFDDLSVLDKFTIQLETQGPDLGHVLAVVGIPDVPHDSFSLSGNVSRDQGGLVVRDVALLLDQSRLVLAGTLPAFPGVDNAHANARLSVHDISRFALLLGLPGELHGKLNIDLDVTPAPGAVGAVFAATATSDSLSLKASGKLLDKPELIGSEVNVDLTGPGLGPITAALALPDGPQIPFEFKAAMVRQAQGFSVPRAHLQMGAHQASVQGMIGNAPLQDDTKLSVKLGGDNLSRLLAAIGAGQNDAPDEPYHLAVELNSASGKLRMPLWQGAIGLAGEYQVAASGQFEPATAPLGTELKLSAHGPDVSKVLELFGIERAPSAEFELDSVIKGVPAGYQLNSLRASMARQQVSVQGILGTDLFSSDTQLQFQASSPALKRALSSYGLAVAKMPEGEFKASGTVTGNGESVRLEQVVINFVGARALINGDLGAFPTLEGSSIKLAARGQNFRWLLPPDSEFTGLDKPFALSAGLSLQDQMIIISSGKFELDSTSMTLESQLGLEPLLDAGSFKLGFNSPDITPLLEKNSVPGIVKVVPVHLNFIGRWQDELWTVEKLGLKSGEGELNGSGTLVRPPNISDSNLRLEGHFANLANFNVFSPVVLPELPVSINAHLLGDEDVLKLETLDLSIGESTLSGDLTVTDGHIPRIVGSLHSSLLDIPSLLPAEEPVEVPEPLPVSNQGKERPGRVKAPQRKVIPDTPIDIDILQRFTADVSIVVDELLLETQPKPVRNIKVELLVKQGGLAVKHFSFDGARGGALDGLLVLKPAAAGPTFEGRINGTQLSVGLPALNKAELEKLPRYDLTMAYSTQGATVRSMAAGLNGYVKINLGRGQVKAGAIQLLTNDFMAQLLETVNPFTDKDPYTTVRCGVILASVEQGKVTGSPALVFRTDRIDVTADLKLDLDTEKLQATFNTAPRKGLGFSFSSLVNPYVMVTGNMANPVLSLDPEGVLVQGGVAVATGGLSIIARGIKARFFSAKDPCGKARLAANEDHQALEAKYANKKIID